LTKNNWENLVINSNVYKPEARYGHSQISLDDERILIIGGCGGPNKQYDDVWILYISSVTNEALWQQVIVNNYINSPSQLYCISFILCEENKKLVTFGKPRIPLASSNKSVPSSSSVISTAQTTFKNPFSGMIGDGFQLNSLNKYTNEQSDAYTLVGQTVQLRKCSCSSLSSTSISSQSTRHQTSKSNDPIDDSDKALTNNEQTPSELQLRLLNKSQRNTIKRLEALKKIASKFNKLEEKEQKLIKQFNSTAYLSKTRKNCVIHSNSMQMFILDVNDLYKNYNSTAHTKLPCVTWQTPIMANQAPPDTILYSLNQGIDELILYGGMEPTMNLKPSNDNIKNRISNKLYIIKPFFI